MTNFIPTFRAPVTAFGIDILAAKGGGGSGYKMRMMRKKKAYTPSASFDLDHMGDELDSPTSEFTTDSPASDSPASIETPTMVG